MLERVADEIAVYPELPVARDRFGFPAEPRQHLICPVDHDVGRFPDRGVTEGNSLRRQDRGQDDERQRHDSTHDGVRLLDGRSGAR